MSDRAASVVFETDEDRARQQVVADRLSRLWGCDIIKRKRLSQVDWSATRDGKLVAVMELKCRKNKRYWYPTLYVSQAKRQALIEESNTFHVPGIFVVQFTDELCWIKASDITGNKTIAGRPRRQGSTHDIEPMIELPVGLLRKI